MLNSVSLQNFRSYKKALFEFGQSTIIIGPNTAGKSNLIESIYLLSVGKSFRAEKDLQMVNFGHEMGRVSASAKQNSDEVKLEIVVTVGEVAGVKTQFKRFFVNGVAKRRVDFVGNLTSVLFSPQDLEVIVGSPGLRRAFLDNVLEQTDRDYRLALLGFTKSLRQRNALLEQARDTGRRNEREFEYWDSLVIRNGSVLTRKREEFVTYLNESKKEILNFRIEYDKSVISVERLLAYRDAETASGNTLVGPHRDDIFIFIGRKEAGNSASLVSELASSNIHSARSSKLPASDYQLELKSFGSRGQQRLGVLQLKILELEYLKKITGNPPLLLLDDVFSELDEGHINLILSIKDNQQTIITTTHEEFIPAKIKNKTEMIELGDH